MRSLIYTSVASPTLTMAAVETLAERAAEANAAVGLTGLLAYNSSRFMQLLEGESEAVLAVMRRIEADPRHNNITYIRQSLRGERECPGWSMRPLLTPLRGIGSATIFNGSLPESMQMDTRILFTSFAATLEPSNEMQLDESDKHVLVRRYEARQ